MSAAAVRPAALAGAFYPAEAAALRAMVGELIDQAPMLEVSPKAVVSPHAGYIYSGPVAATTLKPLARRAGAIKRVVMLGPPHRMPVQRFCVPSVRAFSTPLGEVVLDETFMAIARAHPGVVVDNAPHAQEHCLETQLPFLQHLLGPFTLVPVLVGGASPDEVSALLTKLWGGDETLVLISSDLSHYNDYARTRTLDEAARRAIETLRGDQLGDEQACGRHGLRGLLARAAELDLRATTVDLRNSGDTGGRDRRDRVVGYGGWSFEYAARAQLTDSDRQQLVRVARQAVSLGLQYGRPAQVDVTTFSRPLQAMRASFVTLTLDGQLRGCIGSVTPHEPLAGDVAANAYKAAFQDPRFPKLTREEAARLEVSVSVLSHPRPLVVGSEAQLVDCLNPETDGVILEARDALGQVRRGLFLPHVWQTLPDPRQFVRQLKLKAGLPADGWPAGARLWRYRTETFH